MIKSVKLSNWKSHAKTELAFKPGVNILVGQMGAGKSSIIQSIVYALFGSLPQVKSRDVKISELISRGQSESSVEVEIDSYKIKRSIDRKKGSTDAVVRKGENLVAGPSPNQTNAYIAEFLKVDEDTFLRTVYAQQNEIDLFLRYGPGERKKRIDELMKLDKFETARKNCGKLVNQLKSQIEDKQKILAGTDSGAINKSLKELKEEISSIEKQKTKIKFNLEAASKQLHSSEAEVKRLRSIKEELSKLKERQSMSEEQKRELEHKLANAKLSGTKGELENKLLNIRDQINKSQKDKSSKRNDLEISESERSKIDQQIAVFTSNSLEINKKLSRLESIKQNLERITTIKPNLETDTKILKIKLEDYKQERQKAIANRENEEEHLRQLKSAVGTCPVCDAELAFEKKGEIVSRKEKRIFELTSQAEELQKTISEKQSELEILEEILGKKKELQKDLSERETLRKELENSAKEKEELIKKQRSFIDKINKTKNEIADIESKVNSLNEEYNLLSEQKSLYEAKDKVNELTLKIVDINSKIATISFQPEMLNSAEMAYSSALKHKSDIESQSKHVDLLVNEKKKRSKDLDDQIKRLEKLSAEIDSASRDIEFLTRFGNALVRTQEVLRKELVLAVNEVMSGLWSDMYPYEKWGRLRLLASESDYVLEIQAPDEDWISVAGFASGGERMIACLAMRIAFAKVLAPSISLLFLDEPTHNLDSRAIDSFIEMVQGKLANYLDQVFIVTHEEKLAEAGNLIRM